MVIPPAEPGELLHAPVFVIGCNRSGTTLLFQTVSSHPDLWSRYIENRDRFIEVFPHDGPDGDLVRRCSAGRRRQVERFLYEGAKNRELAIGTPVLEHLPLKLFQKPLTEIFKSPPLQVVDKTPSNCFRVPMLAETFPDARFLYIVRRGEAVVSSLMEGWKHWTGLDGPWEYRDWHYLKPPGWPEYVDRPLEDICAFQYVSANRRAIDGLRNLASERCLVVRHEDLVTSPREEYRRIRRFLNLPSSDHWRGVVAELHERVWTRGGSPPAPGKWRRLHGEQVARVRSVLEPVNAAFYEGDEHLDTT